METAYAARDEQEALDARREARAGNTKVVPPAKAGLNNTPRPAVAIAPSVQTPQVPKPLKLASLAPKPGFIRGRAVFANGQPIPSFQMSAQGFAGEVNLGWAGSMLGLGYQDASNGRYEFRATSSFNRTKILPEALVARVDARAHLSYQGRTYKMDM